MNSVSLIPGIQELLIHSLLLTQNPHVIFAIFLVSLNQVVKSIAEVLKEQILLFYLQAQDAVQELGDGAVWGYMKSETGCLAYI